MNVLKGSIGWKGARGFSAYEIAVQNGFKGTEQDWLATLGTAQHYTRNVTVYNLSASQSKFHVGDDFTSSTLLDVFVNGLRQTTASYATNYDTKEITFSNALKSGDYLEIYQTRLSTSELPIVVTINSEARNDTTPSSKAVYNYVENTVSGITKDLNETISGINETLEVTNTTLETKFDKANIAVVTGSKSNIASGATEIVDVNYPDGFNQANTVIIGKMISSNNNYYDTADEAVTTNGFPIIEMIALMSTGIRIWLKNTNSTQARAGHYKITLMKI